MIRRPPRSTLFRYTPLFRSTWERRDVVMTNWRDGSVNFEQRGVEFPDFWSVNAANIVTTKYFRGAVGTPEREWSLRQDRKSTRLNSSHANISYAVFCLKKII